MNHWFSRTIALVTVLFLMVNCSSELDSTSGRDDAGWEEDATNTAEDSGDDDTTASDRSDTGGDSGDTGDSDSGESNSGDTGVNDTDVGDTVDSEPVDVLVMFLDTGFEFTTPVDIKLNGTWHHFQGRDSSDPIWDSSLNNARGQIITLDEPLTHIEFDPDQLIVDGLNNHGFGFFNYTLQKRHPDTDLGDLSTEAGDPNYWNDPYQDLTTTRARNGYDDIFDPDPYFYDLNLAVEWSDSGKMILYIGGHGRDHPAYGPNEHPEADDPNDPNDPDDPHDPDHPDYPDDPPPPMEPGTVHIALTFLDGVFFDVEINGVTYPFAGRTADDPNWDYAFDNARGEVITTTNLFTTLALDPAQIRVLGINNEGFGFFSYKVVNKNPDADLYSINGIHDDNPEFWGNPADVDPLGVIVNRSGNTITGTQFPDPYFYLGLLDQTTGLRVFGTHWSDTEKMAITFFNYGQDHPDPAPGLEGPWSE